MNKHNTLSLSLSHKLLVPTIVFLGSFSVALIAGVSFLSINPTNAATTSSPIDVAVDIAPVISLTTSASATGNTLSIPIDPSPTGTLGSADLTVSVNTNNLTGYTLTMNSTGVSTDLTHTVEPTHSILSTTNPTASPAALATNTWGYSKWTATQIANSTPPTTYSRIPTLATPDTLTTTTDHTGAVDTKLSFAARADSTLASGTYANTMVFTAVSNYSAAPLDTMQVFDQWWCADMGFMAPAETQLRDSRDNKVYRVRKMDDGNCWMIDNLAYDINGAPATGKPAYATTPEYDFTPMGAPNLTSVATKPQYAMNTAAYNIPNNGNPTPSYLYNWCAAMGDTSANCATTVAYTAGQPSTPQTGICPAGWHLPMGGAEATTPGNGTNQTTAAATTTNEFAKLDIHILGTGTNRDSANSYDDWMDDEPYLPRDPSQYWSGTLSGGYNNGLIDQGSFGLWWSSTASSGMDAYHLYLHSSVNGVYPASNLGKSLGSAVRCMILGRHMIE